MPTFDTLCFVMDRNSSSIHSSKSILTTNGRPSVRMLSSADPHLHPRPACESACRPWIWQTPDNANQQARNRLGWMARPMTVHHTHARHSYSFLLFFPLFFFITVRCACLCRPHILWPIKLSGSTAQTNSTRLETLSRIERSPPPPESTGPIHI